MSALEENPSNTRERSHKIDRLKKGGRPRVLDLFAGAGGLSLGFHTAGFELIAAIEVDSYAARTHALNLFPSASEQQRDLHQKARDIVAIEPDEFLHEFGYEQPRTAVDVIVGGPPCQAFARVGRAKLREVAKHPDAYLNDSRGNLYLRFLHYVKELQPLIILMENVPDALNYGGHNIAQETGDALEEMGYTCRYTLLNSAFYGVPQTRDRMILLAYARELETEVEFPRPTNWIELPKGYGSSRSVALHQFKLPAGQAECFWSEASYYKQPLQPLSELPAAITARQALQDLPPIYTLSDLQKGILKKGVRDLSKTLRYPPGRPSEYAYLMRHWRGFESVSGVTAHVIRYLPRDYRIFANMSEGDEYPAALKIAEKLFLEELNRRRAAGIPVLENSFEYRSLYKEYVPPYDSSKFPNKWRKLESNQPARTVLAHLGKDGYSHIHYDSDQARTISVREAARLQSFPDGFQFVGSLNSSFKQIGNAVPPLLAYQLAAQIMLLLHLKALPLINTL